MDDMLKKLEEFEFLCEGLDHPECVACGPDGFVYAGGESGQIYRVNIDNGEFEEFANTGEGHILGGLCLDADANVYVCDPARGIVKITQSGEVTDYANGSPDENFVFPNYPVFDAKGNMYVSDSNGWDEGNGRMYLIKPGGEGQIVGDRNYQFTNGMCLGPDGKELYVVESNLPGITKSEIFPDGSLGPREEVVVLPRTVPDGVAFDVEGNLFISCYYPDIIFRLTPDGKLDKLVEDWRHFLIVSPTNITFCGPDLSTLVLASLGGLALTKGQMEVPGLPLKYPKL